VFWIVVEHLKAEMVVAHRDKRVLEEQYLAQIIAVSGRVVCGSDVGLVVHSVLD
jgi:hypothetical protein